MGIPILVYFGNMEYTIIVNNLGIVHLNTQVPLELMYVRQKLRPCRRILSRSWKLISGTDSSIRGCIKHQIYVLYRNLPTILKSYVMYDQFFIQCNLL